MRFIRIGFLFVLVAGCLAIGGAISARTTLQIAIADSFIWPVLGRSVSNPLQNTRDPRNDGWYVINGFGNSCPSCSGNSTFKYHPGEDWNLRSCPTCDANEPVYAIANGEVIRSTFMGSGLGWAVIIRHKLPRTFDLRPFLLDGTSLPSGIDSSTDTIVSAYLHLSAPSFGTLDLSQGHAPIPISKGEVISTIYPRTSGGSHLHFEIRYWIGPWESTRTAEPGNQVNGYYRSWQDITNFGYINPSTPGVSAASFLAEFVQQRPRNRSLIRAQGSERVFWYQNGKRYWVLGPDILVAMCTPSCLPGWGISEIKDWPSSIVNEIPRGPDFITASTESCPESPCSEGLLIRQSGTDPVYEVRGGTLRHVSFQECQERNCWPEIIDVTGSILSIFGSQGEEEAGCQEWNRTYGTSVKDSGSFVQPTKDGGFVFVGEVGFRSDDLWSGDIWLVKTNEMGDIRWDKTFGGHGRDFAYMVQETIDGGFIIVGFTQSVDPGNRDIWLIKTDSEGNAQWDKTFGGAGWDAGHAVRQLDDGGYVILGYTCSQGDADCDMWLIRTDSQGTIVWDRIFGGPAPDNSGDGSAPLDLTDDGGFILIGSTESFGAGASDIWLIKTDSQGNKEWDRTYGGTNRDHGLAAQQTQDGGYILTGMSYPGVSRYADLRVMKTDATGTLEWNRSLGGEYVDVGRSVQELAGGGYILLGSTSLRSVNEADVWLIKMDREGNILWEKTFGGPEHDVGLSVQQTPDAGYVLLGGTYSKGAGESDIWLIKVCDEE